MQVHILVSSKNNAAVSYLTLKCESVSECKLLLIYY